MHTLLQIKPTSESGLAGRDVSLLVGHFKDSFHGHGLVAVASQAIWSAEAVLVAEWMQCEWMLVGCGLGRWTKQWLCRCIMNKSTTACSQMDDCNAESLMSDFCMTVCQFVNPTEQKANSELVSYLIAAFCSPCNPSSLLITKEKTIVCPLAFLQCLKLRCFAELESFKSSLKKTTDSLIHFWMQNVEDLCSKKVFGWCIRVTILSIYVDDSFEGCSIFSLHFALSKNIFVLFLYSFCGWFSSKQSVLWNKESLSGPYFYPSPVPFMFLDGSIHGFTFADFSSE